MTIIFSQYCENNKTSNIYFLIILTDYVLHINNYDAKYFIHTIYVHHL